MANWNFLTSEPDAGALYLDCRSEDQYEQGTVKGALGAAFIKKPFGSGPQSTQKLSGYLTALKKAVGEKRIVVFDEGEGMYACRMLWMLYGMDINDARILAMKYQEIPKELLGKGAGQIQEEPGASAVKLKGFETLSNIQQNLTKLQIVDVRMPEEYTGEIPRMINPEVGSVCGRIPGSVNWDWRLLYGIDGHIKGKGELVSQIRKTGIIPERPTLLYDFNGARSCTTALVLSRCGYRQISVYLGSWMEWRKTNLPKQNMQIWKG